MNTTKCLFLIFIAIFFIGCHDKTKKPVEDKDNLNSENGVEEQLKLIKEKYALIRTNLASNVYEIEKSVEESNDITANYERAMKEDTIFYASITECTDHGCDKTSYYFWNGKLIFKFDEKSYWVGQSDEVSESRTYYQDEKKILCLQKTNKGSGGYDLTKKELIKIPQDTLECSGVFNKSSIKDILEFNPNKNHIKK